MEQRRSAYILNQGKTNMNKDIIIEYNKNTQFISKEGVNDMQVSYMYKGLVKDTKENWLAIVGDTQFFLMLDCGDLTKLTEVTHAYPQ